MEGGHRGRAPRMYRVCWTRDGRCVRKRSAVMPKWSEDAPCHWAMCRQRASASTRTVANSDVCKGRTKIGRPVTYGIRASLPSRDEAHCELGGRDPPVDEWNMSPDTVTRGISFQSTSGIKALRLR
ncbi:UNVERIFIED_CONTAM: hypothetical protein Sindi_1139300 [Sesamum indicum]